MEILVVNDGPINWSLGNRRVPIATVKFMAKRGHRITYFGVGHDNHNIPLELKALDVHLITSKLTTCGRAWRKSKIIPSELYAYYNLGRGAQLHDLLRRHKWDLVWFMHLQGNLSYSLIDIAYDLGIPSAMHVMDNFFFCNRSYNYLDKEDIVCRKCMAGKFSYALQNSCTALSSWFYSTARAKLRASMSKLAVVFFQSQQHLELFSDHFDTKEVPLKILDLPVDVQEFEYSTDIGASFVFNGPPKRVKGFHWLLRAAQQRSKYEFILPLSSGMSEIDGFGDLTKNINVIPDCTFDRGLKDILAGARGVLVPSLWDLQCETATVYPMLMGKAVITTNIGWNELNLKDKENALIVDPEDPGTLVEAIDILQNITFASSIGQNAREWGLQRFGETMWNQNLENYLKEIGLDY